MDKRYYTPFELITISAQHARSADNLLQINSDDSLEHLLSVISLLYIAVELLLKANHLHYFGSIKSIKNLTELVELNDELGFSQQETHLLKLLSQQHAFRKGIDYNLWENQQQLHIFCLDINKLYKNLQTRLPIELDAEYQSL